LTSPGARRGGQNAAGLIDHVNARLDSAADVGFVEAPQNVEELRTVGRSLRGPALVNVFEGDSRPSRPPPEREVRSFRTFSAAV
jgi:2-methylisocitrate lyase-like PEP mutase family enzyme